LKNFLKYTLYFCSVAHAMAVCTQEYALLQFFEDCFPATAKISTDVEVFLSWVQMVELQRCDTPVVPAVDTSTAQVLDRPHLGTDLSKQRLASKTATAAPSSVITANTAIHKWRAAVSADAFAARPIYAGIVLAERRAYEAELPSLEIPYDTINNDSQRNWLLANSTISHG